MSQRLEQREASERCVTERLRLRRPRTTDAAAILRSYAGDPDVSACSRGRATARSRTRWPSRGGAIRCGAARPQGVGSENSVTSCDLQILVYQARKALSS